MASAAQRILVTGASSGVGAALVKRLAGHGKALALVGRDRGRLDAVASEAKQLGAVVAVPIAVDLAQASGPSYAWRQSLDAFGDVPSTVVCCHGIGIHGSAEAVSMDDYDTVFATNVRSVFEIIRHALPPMRSANSGSIVVVSSVLGRFGGSERVLYCGSKHAVEGIVAAVRKDVKGSGIKCSTVCPAGIDTPWWDRPLYADGKERPKPASKFLLTADEVVDAIVRLLEQETDSDIATIVLQPGKEPECIL